MVKSITSFNRRKGGPPKKLVSRTDKKGRGCQRQNVQDDKRKKIIRSKKLVEDNIKNKWRNENTEEIDEKVVVIEQNVKDVKENYKRKRGRPKKVVNENDNTEKSCAKHPFDTKKRRRYSADSEESDTEPKKIVGDEAKFVCCTCRDDVKMTAKELRAHVKVVHKRRSVHYFKLHKDNRPHCEICSKELITDKRLKEHLESHSNDFICESCGMYFKKLIEYTLHLRLHNSEEMFDCVLCEFKTDSINDITTHVNTLHSDNYEYMCKKCGKKFYTLSWLKEHEDYHKGKRSFKCSYCFKKFSYSRYLFTHKIKKHEKHEELEDNSYKCVICRKKYGSKRGMEGHMNKNHAGNLAICDICGLVLSSNENLKFHMRTHTGYKPFTCTNCGKSFARKGNLIEHVRTHTGEKPYTCEHCFKGFTQRSSLVIHIRGHTGEKPFVCHICNKAFAVRALLNVHLKTGKCVVE